MLSLRNGLKISREISPFLRNTIFSWAKGEVGALTSHTKFKPHTIEYIKQQIQICKSRGIPAEIQVLPKGIELIGPMNSSDILLGSQAVYPNGTLNLSDNEVESIISHSPLISVFTLNNSLHCLKSLGDHGQDVYYIHTSELKVGEVRRSEELREIATKPSI